MDNIDTKVSEVLERRAQCEDGAYNAGLAYLADFEGQAKSLTTKARRGVEKVLVSRDRAALAKLLTDAHARGIKVV